MTDDITLGEMLAMQRALWERYKDKWAPLEPPAARDSLLWMVEELGEVIAIIKKRGEAEIMADPALRADFVEELADVYMYLNDVLMRYGVTAQEMAAAYRAKHRRNMGRDFVTEHQNYRRQP